MDSDYFSWLLDVLGELGAVLGGIRRPRGLRSPADPHIQIPIKVRDEGDLGCHDACAFVILNPPELAESNVVEHTSLCVIVTDFQEKEGKVPVFFQLFFQTNSQ